MDKKVDRFFCETIITLIVNIVFIKDTPNIYMLVIAIMSIYST